jgi:hypothetical protein
MDKSFFASGLLCGEIFSFTVSYLLLAKRSEKNLGKTRMKYLMNSTPIENSSPA